MEKSEKLIEFEKRRKEIEERKKQLELDEEQLNLDILKECLRVRDEYKNKPFKWRGSYESNN